MYLLLQIFWFLQPRVLQAGVKKIATTTEEISRILRLVANFTGTGENKVQGNLYIRAHALRLAI